MFFILVKHEQLLMLCIYFPLFIICSVKHINVSCMTLLLMVEMRLMWTSNSIYSLFVYLSAVSFFPFSLIVILRFAMEKSSGQSLFVQDESKKSSWKTEIIFVLILNRKLRILLVYPHPNLLITLKTMVRFRTGAPEPHLLFI